MAGAAHASTAPGPAFAQATFAAVIMQSWGIPSKTAAISPKNLHATDRKTAARKQSLLSEGPPP